MLSGTPLLILVIHFTKKALCMIKVLPLSWLFSNQEHKRANLGPSYNTAH